jgi:hypothetical protein
MKSDFARALQYCCYKRGQFLGKITNQLIE